MPAPALCADLREGGFLRVETEYLKSEYSVGPSARRVFRVRRARNNPVVKVKQRLREHVARAGDNRGECYPLNPAGESEITGGSWAQRTGPSRTSPGRRFRDPLAVGRHGCPEKA